jgi:predicted metal-dependent RNase
MAKKLVQHAIQHKSKIIVPAFSTGRTQDIIMRIKDLVKNGEVDPIPIFIDSPLALKATKGFRQHPECYDEETYRTFTPTSAFRFNLASSQINFSTHRYSIEALLELLRQEATRSKMRWEQE